MSKMIYLDHAATTRTLPEVAAAMEPYQDIYYGNPSTIYEFGEKSREAIEYARRVIAKTIRARPEEIYFTSGGTESDNWALKEAVHLYERVKRAYFNYAGGTPCNFKQLRGAKTDGMRYLVPACGSKRESASCGRGKCDFGTRGRLPDFGYVCQQ